MISFLNKCKYWMVLILLFVCVVSSRSYAMIELTEKENAVNSFILDGFLLSLPISNGKENMVKILKIRFGAVLSTKTEIVDDDRRHRLKNEESRFKFDGIVIKTMMPLQDEKRKRKTNHSIA